MGGGAAVRVGGGGQLAGGGVDIPEALGGTGEAVGEVEARVEPLRRVGGGHLVGEHVLEFVLEGLGVVGGGKVTLTLAPVPPGAGEAVEDLARRALRPCHGLAVGVEDGGAVGVELGDTGLAEVLGHHDVGGHLAPTGRHLGVGHLENDRAVGIGDA